MPHKGLLMFKLFFNDPKGQALTASNYLHEYSIVYCLWPKTIMKLGSNGFFHEYGKRAGILVKRVHGGDVWYHNPEEYLMWKKHLDVRFENEIKQ